jgi:hypothetical protein
LRTAGHGYIAAMQSKAPNVAKYLAGLPADRREAIAAVREVILDNLDRDYEEGMQYGMMGYYVPHRVFPPGYHCDPKQPLPFAGLASQKNHRAVYLMGLYLPGAEGELQWFQQAWAKAGKRLDMGKSCVRFKKLDDVALDVLGEAIRRMPAKRYVAVYQEVLATHWKKAAGKSAAGSAARPAAKAGASKAAKGAATKPTVRKQAAGKSPGRMPAARKKARPAAR